MCIFFVIFAFFECISPPGCLVQAWWRSTRRSLIPLRDQTIPMTTWVKSDNVLHLQHLHLVFLLLSIVLKITWRSLCFKLCTVLLNNVRELNNEVVQSTQALCVNSMRQIYTTYHTDVQYMLTTPPPTDYPAGYASGEAKSSKNLIGSAKGNFAYASVDGFEDEAAAQPVATQHSAVYVSFADAILNMVNNIAVNVLGGGEPEMQGANGAVRELW